MDSNLVSVIMPVRNHASYLQSAINSVINQTSDSWELIIVDDSSEDESAQMIKDNAAKDHRIKAHFLEESLKRAGLVRNIAIEANQNL